MRSADWKPFRSRDFKHIISRNLIFITIIIIIIIIIIITIIIII